MTTGDPVDTTGDPVDDARLGGPHGRQCSATSKRSAQRCKRAPVPGATVCNLHGGKAPQVQAAAKRRLLAEELRAIKDVELDDDDVDPTVAVLGALNVARERLRLLRVVYGDALLAGDPAAVRLEGEAIDRVGKLARLAIDLGARERLERARDAFADVIAAAHKASIARLSERKGLILDDADLAEVANYFADELVPLGRDPLNESKRMNGNDG